MRVASEIAEGIRGGEWQVGAKLPSERLLCERYGASTITIRRALREITQLGLIVTRPGDGSFVQNAGAASTGDGGQFLGLIIVNSGGYFNGWVVENAEIAARKSGYSTVIKHSQNDPAKEIACINELVELGVAGLVIVPVICQGQELLATYTGLMQAGIPFVLADRYLPDLDCSYVVGDNETGGYEATQHLVDQGHRRIAHISSRLCSSTLGRERGYCRALAKAGISIIPELIAHVGYDDQSVLEASRAMLCSAESRPTAVFAADDRIARLVYQVCEEMSLRIPNDIAVVGYDNAPYAALLDPPLTTVSQFCGDIGTNAVELLIKSITARGRIIEQMTVRHELVVRDSSVCGVSASGSRANRQVLEISRLNRSVPKKLQVK